MSGHKMRPPVPGLLKVAPDRLLHLVSISLLCFVAATVSSIKGGVGHSLVGSAAKTELNNLVSPPLPSNSGRQRHRKSATPAAGSSKSQANHRAHLDAWISTLPMELHIASINVTREPFLYANILQDEDSYQVRDPNVTALEPGLTALWLDKAAACCARGGSVIDVGAHFGYYSLLGASMGCTFTAIEPVPSFRTILEANVRLNDKAGVGSVLPYAVGLESRTTHMELPENGVLGLARVVQEGESSEHPDWVQVEVEQRRMDDILKEVPQPREVCVMKIDVEGREPDVILSASKLLKTSRVQHIMLEFSPGYSMDGLEEMLIFLHKRGYKAWDVWWDRAKLDQRVQDIDPTLVLNGHFRVDLSTEEGRQAYINSTLPYTNSNLWLSLPAQHAA